MKKAKKLDGKFLVGLAQGCRRLANRALNPRYLLEPTAYRRYVVVQRRDFAKGPGTEHTVIYGYITWLAAMFQVRCQD